MPENLLPIDDFSFGRLRIGGKDYRNDLLLVQGRVKADWWRLHSHKIMTEDVAEILDAQPDVIVVGRGHSNQLQVDEELADLLNRKGIQLVLESTPNAVATYNRLVDEGTRVAGAFHLTC